MSEEKPFRLMLAEDSPLTIEAFAPHLPLLGSYKLDGIRAAARSGLVSRTMKPIRNVFAQREFGTEVYEGLDGELLACTQTGETLYHDTYSVVMTHGCLEPCLWFIFDKWNALGLYSDRMDNFREHLEQNPHPNIRILEQRLLPTLDDIRLMEEQALNLGHEGLILRRADRLYKQGRATFKEGGLIKLARKLRSEAEVIGFEEMMHNDNEAIIDARGYTKRASNKANMRPAGMLGSFVVRDLKTNMVFNLGGQLDHTLRRQIWENQSDFLGKIAFYEYKPYGTKDLPRQPSWIGWRHPDDIGGE